MKQNTILQSAWVWNESVTNFVKDKIEGYSLNVCAGKNPICDVNLDLDPQDKTIIKGDMKLLKFKSNTFDTVISDPPWKIGFFQRMKPFFECVRVCKLRGRIIYNCTWKPRSKCVELEEAVIRTDNKWANVLIIYVFKKIKEIEEITH